MQGKFMRQFAIRCTLAAALAASAFPAQAHRPWLLPSSTLIDGEREAWVTIDGAVSESLFEIDHLPLRMDGLSVTGPDGVTSAAPAATVGKFRASVDLKLPAHGTYRITLATSSVTGSYRLNGETRRFRASAENAEREVPAGATEVKTVTLVQRQDVFVTVDKPGGAALKPTGSGLELVPLTHPNELRAGEQATFRFQLDGKPLANFPFSLIAGGVKYRGTLGELRLQTDASGEARFTLPAPNMYWLNAAWPANAARGPGADGPAQARRYGYSATLEILPE